MTRLHVSEKAQRQLKNMPPHDCGTHPKTSYIPVPDHLRDRMADDYDYGCEECIRALDAQVSREKAEEKRRLRELEKRDREAKRAAEERALTAQGKLGEMCRQAENWQDRHAERSEVAEQGVENAAEQVKAVRALIARREEEMLRARQALARAKARLADEEERLAAAEHWREEVGNERPFAYGTIKTAIDTCEEAWQDVPKRRRRKKINRRLLKRARKLLDGLSDVESA